MLNLQPIRRSGDTRRQPDPGRLRRHGGSRNSALKSRAECPAVTTIARLYWHCTAEAIFEIVD
jgi:hypothetical protein